MEDTKTCYKFGIKTGACQPGFELNGPAIYTRQETRWMKRPMLIKSLKICNIRIYNKLFIIFYFNVVSLGKLFYV